MERGAQSGSVRSSSLSQSRSEVAYAKVDEISLDDPIQNPLSKVKELEIDASENGNNSVISNSNAENATVLHLKAASAIPVRPSFTWEFLLLISGLGIGTYIGVFARYATEYYKIWPIEVNYSILWANLVGSLIMGFASVHKKAFYEASNVRMCRILFVSVTTGLCGSLTTFSTWQFQCFKNIFLQFDLTYTDLRGSYNGARFNEWVVSLLIGVGMPLLALRVGQHIAELLSPLTNARLVALEAEEDSSKVHMLLEKYGIRHADVPKEDDKDYSEHVTVGFFLLSTFLILILPTAAIPNWGFICAISIFGVIGTYLRYCLAPFNAYWKQFPVGTFTANVVGTCCAALVNSVARFWTPHDNIPAQSVLMGLFVGFCG